MTREKYLRAIEALIATQQDTQRNNPPTSPAWIAASAEINRLAALHVAAKNGGR